MQWICVLEVLTAPVTFKFNVNVYHNNYNSVCVCVQALIKFGCDAEMQPVMSVSVCSCEQCLLSAISDLILRCTLQASDELFFLARDLTITQSAPDTERRVSCCPD